MNYSLLSFGLIFLTALNLHANPQVSSCKKSVSGEHVSFFGTNQDLLVDSTSSSNDTVRGFAFAKIINQRALTDRKKDLNSLVAKIWNGSSSWQPFNPKTLLSIREIKASQGSFSSKEMKINELLEKSGEFQHLSQSDRETFASELLNAKTESVQEFLLYSSYGKNRLISDFSPTIDVASALVKEIEKREARKVAFSQFEKDSELYKIENRSDLEKLISKVEAEIVSAGLNAIPSDLVVAIQSLTEVNQFRALIDSHHFFSQLSTVEKDSIVGDFNYIRRSVESISKGLYPYSSARELIPALEARLVLLRRALFIVKNDDQLDPVF